MPGPSFSIQEIRVFQALRFDPGRWLTISEISAAALVTPDSAHDHAARFVAAGIAETAEREASPRFRLKDRAACADTTYLDQLEQAVAVLSGIAADRP